MLGSSKLKSENEALRRQLALLNAELLKSSSTTDSVDAQAASATAAKLSSLQDQLKRLTAQNLALQTDNARLQALAAVAPRPSPTCSSPGAGTPSSSASPLPSPGAPHVLPTYGVEAARCGARLMHRPTALAFGPHSPTFSLQREHALQLNQECSEWLGATLKTCKRTQQAVATAASALDELSSAVRQVQYARWLGGLTPLCEGAKMIAATLHEVALYTEGFGLSLDAGVSQPLQTLSQDVMPAVATAAAQSEDAEQRAGDALDKLLHTLRGPSDVARATASVSGPASADDASLQQRLFRAVAAAKKADSQRLQLCRAANDAEAKKRFALMTALVGAGSACRAYFAHCATVCTEHDADLANLQDLSQAGEQAHTARSAQWLQLASAMQQAHAHIVPGAALTGATPAPSPPESADTSGVESPALPPASPRVLDGPALLAALRASMGDSSSDLHATLDALLALSKLVAQESRVVEAELQAAAAADATAHAAGLAMPGASDGVAPGNQPALSPTLHMRALGSNGAGTAKPSLGAAAVSAVGGGAGQALSLTPRGGAPAIAGYLLKRSSNIRKEWQRRWFVIQGGRLYYVRGTADMAPQLITPLAVANVREMTDGDTLASAGAGGLGVDLGEVTGSSSAHGHGGGPASAHARRVSSTGLASKPGGFMSKAQALLSSFGEAAASAAAASAAPDTGQVAHSVGNLPRAAHDRDASEEQELAVRPYVFEVRSPSHRPYLLQAPSRACQLAWIAALRQGTEDALHQHGPTGGSRAATGVGGSGGSGGGDGVGSLAHDPLMAALQQWVDLGNQQCADCGAAQPDWAIINRGALLCMQCAGVHRSLGAHVSKVRSVTLDRWEEHTLGLAASLGNARVNELWEASRDALGIAKPSPQSSRADREAFIRLKWVDGAMLPLPTALLSLPDAVPCAVQLQLEDAELTGHTPARLLCTAAALADVRGMFALLSVGVPADAGLPGGVSLLQAAAAESSATPSTAAFQAHVDLLTALQAEDVAGWTVLHAAAWSGSMACVELAIHAGAPVQQADEAGRTALYIAHARAESLGEAGSAGLAMDDPGDTAAAEVKLAALAAACAAPLQFSQVSAYLSKRTT